MLDVPSAAACLPGTTVDGRDDHGRNLAVIAVRVGPVHLRYDGTVEISDQDDAARTATLLAEGREQRGRGAARAAIALCVAPAAAEGSSVTIAIELDVAGRVAQLGHGLLQPVASSMIERFAACLERRLLAPADGDRQPAAEPDEVPAVSLLFKAMWGKIRHPHHDGGA